MKKSILALSLVTLSMLFSAFTSTSVLAATKKPVAPANSASSAEVKKEKYYKVEWYVKKTGTVIVTRSTVINLSDPDNQSKTGKLVFAPQRVPTGNGAEVFFVGLGLDMKLFENKGKPILGMVGIYTDPNPLIDFTEKMPDEQTVAHSIITTENHSLASGQSQTLNVAKFVKAYDLTQPNGQETTLTRFIIKEPNTASLIEITFKVYAFDVADKDKPKE